MTRGSTATAIAYPYARRSDHKDVFYDGSVVVHDPYRWLEEGPECSEETRAWIDAQNALTTRLLSGVGGDGEEHHGRAAYLNELQSLEAYVKNGCPFRRGAWHFCLQKLGLQNQFVLYKSTERGAIWSLLARGDDDDDGGGGGGHGRSTEAEVLLDPNGLAEDGTAALGSMAFSPDGSLLAYGINRAGSDWASIRVRDVATGVDFDGEELHWCKFYTVAWLHDASGFYYCRFPVPASFAAQRGEHRDDEDAGGRRGTETDRAERHAVYFHRLGTPQSADRLVYRNDAQPDWMYGVEVTDDGRYLLITVAQDCAPKNLVYVVDLAQAARRVGVRDDEKEAKAAGASAERDALVEVVGEFTAEFDYIANDGTRFYFKTNKDAPRGRVVAVDIDARGAERAADSLQEVVPEHAGTAVLEMCAAAHRDALVLVYLEDVKHRVEVRRLADGAFVRHVALPGIGCVAGISARREFSDMHVKFTSMLDPGQVLYYELGDARGRGGGGEMQVVHRTRVPCFDPTPYTTVQRFYTSADGTRVPMFLVGPRHVLAADAAADGRRVGGEHRPPATVPCLLYGYGGFSISITPFFSLTWCLWLRRFGGVVAVANLRGGGEYGEAWHEAGCGFNKQCVFDDFCAAAEYLSFTARLTEPSKLVSMGGSNGGLLVAACANQRPELFGVVVAKVGVMDMVRFHRFTIGHAWASDYLSADHSKAALEYLLTYSPVHNCPPRAEASASLPAVLCCTSDHDDRVVPLHSFKYMAALQHAAPRNERPLLIRIERKAGHGAGKPTSKQHEETADMLAFIRLNLRE